MAGAEAAIITEHAGKPGKHSHCLNCGTALSGPYCSNCGQKDLPTRQNIGDLLVNFLSSFFSFESKLFTTLSRLAFKPGSLALMYNAGMRDRFYHPARMYVFLSFIFFLLFAGLSNSPDAPDQDGNDVVLLKDGDGEAVEPDSLILGSPELQSAKAYDSIQAALPPGDRDGGLVRYFKRRSATLNEQNQNGTGLWKTFNDAYAKNIPKMIFLLLPFFALLLKLLYIRRDFYYAEHLIFTVFFYCFVFFAGIIILLIDLTPWHSSLQEIFIAYIFLYLLLAMKRAYRQSWPKTFFKYGLLLGGFFILLMGALVANVLATFATL